MATWLDSEDRTWVFDDNKLNFDDWILDSKLVTEWDEACAEHYEWFTANPDKAHSNHNGKAGVIFKQWAVYANATPPSTK